MISYHIQKISLLIIAALFFIMSSASVYALVYIVAAENIYGEVAKELGGPYVKVESILNNPSQDPHLFTITPSTAKAVSMADIVIYNGADYDPWVLAMEGPKGRIAINVASLISIKPGANPHIWYLPTTMPIFAKTLVAALVKLDSQHKAYYEQQLKQFNLSYRIIFETVDRLRKRLQNIPVIATEPVFGYMAKSLGLNMHGEGFQINMMNDVPPSISQIKSFENDLRQHNVRLLIYNNQVKSALTEHMQKLAEQEKIPLLGVSELIPPNMTYIQWIMKELRELENALAYQQGHSKDK